MRLDIDSLRTFKTVLELGGVTRAAERLNLSQSAVSHKLARLEERIGRPILYKGSGGLTATVDGTRLLSYAERLVSLHDEAIDQFKLSELAGEIRLGSTEDATESKLAAVMGRFRRLHPHTALSIRVAQSLTLKFWLETSELDLAILQIFVDDKEPGDVELWREDLVWAQAIDNPLPLSKKIPFVSFDKNCIYRLAARQRLAESGRSLDVILECPSKQGVRAGILSGLGIGLLSRRNLTHGLTELVADLPSLPQVCHVLRSQAGAIGDLQKSLTETVLRELVDAEG